jgi:hypothetical protein
MKLIKWTGQVQDRLKWKDTVEKIKTVPELWRHRRRRREEGLQNIGTNLPFWT